MAKSDYITLISGRARLYIYQSDIQNSTAADPYVSVSVYLQYYRSSSGSASYQVGTWSAGLLGDTYTNARSSGTGYITGSWTGWKTVDTVFSSKGIWSVSKTRTSFNVRFSGNVENGPQTTQYVSVNQSISMQAWPVSGTKDTMSVTSSMTMGSSYTISITHKTSGNKNTLTWKFGSQSGTLLSKSTSTSVTFSPSTSLGAQIPSASSGTVTFTLSTYNSAGTSLGSSTYTSTLNVPSYSIAAPTVSAAKNSYTGIGAYVANKTQTRFTLSGLPSGSYGATVSGSYVIKLAGVQQTSGAKSGTSSSNVDYTAAGAGALQLTYTVKDSRGKSNSASASVTYVANAAPTISFSADRDASTPTNWSGTATGTYLNVSGNTATITFTEGTAGTNTASGGTVSRTVSGTCAETSTLPIKATITDSLGNTASRTATIATVFAYMECTPNHVIALGRKASLDLSGRAQIGLPTYFDNLAATTTEDAYIGSYASWNRMTSGVAVPGAATTSVGWYRVAHIYPSGSYPNGIAFLEGGYNSGAPTIVAMHICRRNGDNLHIRQIGRAALGIWTKARIVEASDGATYLDLYCGTAVAYQRSDLRLALIGQIHVTYLHPTTTVSANDYTYISAIAFRTDPNGWATSNGWIYRIDDKGTFNGYYTRKLTSIAVNQAWGNQYTSAALSKLTYPVTFTGVPHEQVTVTGASTGTSEGSAWIINTGGTQGPTLTQTGSYQLVRPNTSTMAVTLEYHVVGAVAI